MALWNSNHHKRRQGSLWRNESRPCGKNQLCCAREFISGTSLVHRYGSASRTLDKSESGRKGCTMALPDKNNWKSAHYSIKPYHIFLYEGATKIVLSDYWHPFKENISTHSYFYLDLNKYISFYNTIISNLVIFA